MLIVTWHEHLVIYVTVESLCYIVETNTVYQLHFNKKDIKTFHFSPLSILLAVGLLYGYLYTHYLEILS